MHNHKTHYRVHKNPPTSTTQTSNILTTEQYLKNTNNDNASFNFPNNDDYNDDKSIRNMSVRTVIDNRNDILNTSRTDEDSSINDGIFLSVLKHADEYFQKQDILSLSEIEQELEREIFHLERELTQLQKEQQQQRHQP